MNQPRSSRVGRRRRRRAHPAPRLCRRPSEASSSRFGVGMRPPKVESTQSPSSHWLAPLGCRRCCPPSDRAVAVGRIVVILGERALHSGRCRWGPRSEHHAIAGARAGCQYAVMADRVGTGRWDERDRARGTSGGQGFTMKSRCFPGGWARRRRVRFPPPPPSTPRFHWRFPPRNRARDKSPPAQAAAVVLRQEAREAARARAHAQVQRGHGRHAHHHRAADRCQRQEGRALLRSGSHRAGRRP